MSDETIRNLGAQAARLAAGKLENRPMASPRPGLARAVPPFTLGCTPMLTSKAKMTRERFIAVLGGTLLLVAILVAYSNHFQNGFHMDDGHAIVNNAAIRELRNIPLFFRDATTFSALPSNQSYRPLVSTLLALDYRLAHGFEPFWFHLSIFALFLALTLLLVFVIYQLLVRDTPPSSARWLALAAAGFYALHPANADAVNYIIVVSEVMATLGVVASFAAYFAFPGFRRYFLYVLPAAIAILAKPTAAIFPVLFAIFRFCMPNEKHGAPTRPRLMEILPPFLLCGAVLFFVQHMTPRTWAAGAADAQSYLVTQPYVALLYFKTFFWPTALSADYDLKPFVTASDPRLWIGFAFAVLLTATAIVAGVFQKTRVIGFGLLWFLFALLPTSLFPLAEAMNDYRTFLPYIGLVIAIAGAAALLVARFDRPRSWTRIAAVGAVVLFLGANACATFQRNKVWKTEETLWHDVVLKGPRNARGLMTYGITLVNMGDYAGALPYLRRAQQFAPPYSVLSINLALAEDATAQSAAAEQHFKEALRLAPLSPDSYIYYARYLLSHDRAEEAGPLLRRAVEISPGDRRARELLQETEARRAETHTRTADALLRQGKFGEATTEYETALQNPPYLGSTLNNFAWLLATCPDASLRNGARAIEMAARADQLAGDKNPVFLRTLAAAYAEVGRFADAIETAHHAWQIARAQENFDLAKRLEKDAGLYRHNLPLHPVAPSNSGD